MAALIGSKPEIVGESGLELTLRFASEDEKTAFIEAVHKAHLTDDEFRAEYAKKNGIDQGILAD